MKAKIFLLALLLPLTAAAQQNIMKAWKNFETQSDVTIDSEKHSIDKDPETGKKTYHVEYWSFSVPKNRFQLIESFAKAFDTDADHAYSVNQGITTRADEIQLAVGTTGNTGTAYVGSKKGSNYKYCLFLDPEDPEGNCRYSYSLDWINAGDKYTGTFMITYATTLKYRQSQSQKTQQPSMDSYYSNGVYDWDQSWFSKFMSFVTTIEKGSPTARQFIAGQIFDLTKAAPTQADKDTAIDVLNSMLPDLEKSKDSVTITIIKNCIKNLQQ
ncbi:MAG: hypothetical protein K2N16_01750 [Muribaculaceae bacterium]|nr:hypothetical protein [Muribaculaceae bacterium]